MNQHAQRIGVLSSLDPASWQSDVVARVMRAQIDLHNNDVSLDLRSIRERAALGRAWWQPALTAAWPTTVSTVVVEHDIETHDRERAGAASITAIETDMFADPMLWCGLFEQTLDPAAVETVTAWPDQPTGVRSMRRMPRSPLAGLRRAPASSTRLPASLPPSSW
jgi:hypothetical protein